MPLLNVAGADIYYELAGYGRPAIVLVHGGMCDHHDWTVLRRTLATNHTVLVLDLRAHGKSGGDPATCSGERWGADVNALIEQLNLAPAVIVGHSMGSRIAAEAIQQQPGNFAGLVLLDGSRAYAEPASAPPPAAGPLPSPTDVINVTIGPYANDDVRAQIMTTMSSASEDLMMGCLRAMKDWDTNRSAAVFSGLPRKLPVLAIQSTYHDPSTPRRYLESENDSTPYLDFLRKALPQFEAKILTRTGHFSMMERPQDVARLIGDFVRRNCT